MTETGGLHNRRLFPTVLEAGKVPEDSISGEDLPSWPAEGHLPVVFSQGGAGPREGTLFSLPLTSRTLTPPRGGTPYDLI